MTTSSSLSQKPADPHSFRLDAEKWAAFMAAMDAPTRDLPRLKRLLSEPSIFSGRGRV
ncbi:DUF1778 domain-containing protein [Mesorhizobium sp. M1088]|uniref:type II toxin -antitoxin system TacA 1-like antitoxin n=1 Tax=Mesorhizobium sp. M1088 TaxID=2957056 RepID=UPI00333AD02D